MAKPKKIALSLTIFFAIYIPLQIVSFLAVWGFNKFQTIPFLAMFLAFKFPIIISLGIAGSEIAFIHVHKQWKDYTTWASIFKPLKTFYFYVLAFGGPWIVFAAIILFFFIWLD